MSSPTYTGSCYCRAIQYEINLDSPSSPSSSSAHTSICHCQNCKKFTGSPFGTTTKLPLSSLHITAGDPVVHIANNRSGTQLRREFCGTCGSPIQERGEHAGDFTYVFYGTLDERGRRELRPKGEFFCKVREEWVGDVKGDVFRKQGIKE
ncbi:MAG: hypothetical protein M1834_003725 [Cirrosporium novae-zelandiae]|nr:MAG: hypothetical protein M1834_003725 [Cirrosporium novae-zelandiae]